jgi:hypothetical protein
MGFLLTKEEFEREEASNAQFPIRNMNIRDIQTINPQLHRLSLILTHEEKWI